MEHRVTMPSRPTETAQTGDDRKLPSGHDQIVADPRDEIEHHVAAMRAFALVLARHREIADDIVRRTIVAAWSNIDAFDSGTNMRVWLFRMIRNAYCIERGSAERDVTNEFTDFVGLLTAQTGPDGGLADAHFRRAFNALPDEQREALVLLGPEEFSLHEAAAVCGCTPVMIRNRARLGRRTLSALVSPKKNDPSTIVNPASIEAIGRHDLAGEFSVQTGTALSNLNGKRPSGSFRPTARLPRRGAPG